MYCLLPWAWATSQDFSSRSLTDRSFKSVHRLEAKLVFTQCTSIKLPSSALRAEAVVGIAIDKNGLVACYGSG